MENQIVHAIDILQPLILSLLALAAATLVGLIRKHISNAYVKGLLERLDAAVFTAVNATEQTFVSNLRSGAIDGKLSAADAAKAKDMAIAQAKQLLGENAVAQLSKVFDASTVQAWLDAKVEAAVRDAKPLGGVLGTTLQDTPAPAPTPAVS